MKFADKVAKLVQEILDTMESAMCIIVCSTATEDDGTHITIAKETQNFDEAYASYLMALVAAAISKTVGE